MFNIGINEIGTLYYNDKEVNFLNLAEQEVYNSNTPEYLKAFKKVTTITQELVDSLNIQDIEHIIIPKNVTNVEAGAFSSCQNIEHLTVPQALINQIKNNIAYNVNFGSELLITITHTQGRLSGNITLSIPFVLEIQNGCTKIGTITSNLVGIVIPDSVTSIMNGALSNCSNLIELSMPCSAYIYNGAFTNVNVEKVVLTKGTGIMRYSDDYAPWVVSNKLEEIILQDGITNICSYAFKNCSGLTSVTIPDSVTSIGSGAFYGCSGLTSITIPDSVTSINDSAFRSCNKLESITIGSSVNNINHNFLFADCTNLKDIIVDKNNTKYDSRDDCNAIIETATNQLIKGCNSTVIHNSVTSIAEYAFFWMNGLTSVTIPDSVTSIGSYAFGYCDSLTSVTIPNYVTSISDSTFQDCTNLINVTIGNSVTSIGDSAFNNCKKLTNLYIQSPLTNMGNYAFYGCRSLKNIYISDIAAWCQISLKRSPEDSPIYYAKKIYLNNELVTDLIIPDSVTSIGSYAFGYCDNLTSVDIPDSVTSIGSSAFTNCSNLTSVKLSNSISTINGWTFGSCKKLLGIIIPSSVTSIGYNAFYECSGLADIQVDTNNTKYDSRNNCNAIIETETNKLILACKNTVIPDSVTSIGSQAFSYSGLTSITIPNSVTSIDSNTFYGCTGLTSVEVYKDFNINLKINSGNYSVEVMVNIFNNLKDLTGETSKTLTLGSTNLAKLTEEQKAIATNKNWVLK